MLITKTLFLSRHGLSQIEWYKARLLQEPRFARFGRLAGEYLVDMFSRTEDQRLAYIKFNRSPNPAAQAGEDDEKGLALSGSFHGSKAWCSGQVADALALARRYGAPSFFVTMTCNPKWPELASQLLPGQDACDQPVVTIRVFKQRLRKCIEWLEKNWGKVIWPHVVCNSQLCEAIDQFSDCSVFTYCT